MSYTLHFRKPHNQQERFLNSTAKRKVIRAGRRSGKTVGIGILAGREFLKKRRVLYGAPTQDQVSRFWHEVVATFREPIDAGVIYKNESSHILEIPGSEVRIRAKTCWNADTLRGDYCDLLILDEWQLMNEDAWKYIGEPMLLDHNGDAVFIYTPPTLRSRSVTKAWNPMHAAELYREAEADKSGLWETFHFTSHDNPHISKDALETISQEMSSIAYKQEILAEDIDEIPGAMWSHKTLSDTRRSEHPSLTRVVVGVDPQGRKKTKSETGIVVAGRGIDLHGYVIGDYSINGTPQEWGRAVVNAYHDHKADCVVVETNYGGEMVRQNIKAIDSDVTIKEVSASRGKIIRAEPIAARYEQDKIHHVGMFPLLEGEMCFYTPEVSDSPNRMDALVWALTELMTKQAGGWKFETGKIRNIV